MVLLAQRIDYVECLTSFEASIQELRLIVPCGRPTIVDLKTKKLNGGWCRPPPLATLYQMNGANQHPHRLLSVLPQRRTAATLAQVLQPRASRFSTHRPYR